MGFFLCLGIPINGEFKIIIPVLVREIFDIFGKLLEIELVMTEYVALQLFSNFWADVFPFTVMIQDTERPILR